MKQQEYLCKMKGYCGSQIVDRIFCGMKNPEICVNGEENKEIDNDNIYVECPKCGQKEAVYQGSKLFCFSCEYLQTLVSPKKIELNTGITGIVNHSLINAIENQISMAQEIAIEEFTCCRSDAEDFINRDDSKHVIGSITNTILELIQNEIKKNDKRVLKAINQFIAETAFIENGSEPKIWASSLKGCLDRVLGK